MNTCPHCHHKFKTSIRKYCSRICYLKSDRPKKIITRKSESKKWREYWLIKLHKYRFSKISQYEYETMDKIFNHQLFTNMRAKID